MLKKIFWIIKRHPYLYLTRFRLLSRNIDRQKIEAYTYNSLNSKYEIPNYFSEINVKIFSNGVPESDFDKVYILCKWLVTQIKGGPGLSVDSEEALRIMLLGKGGVCSDMAQIFNNFCVINDIQVREWGSTRAPYEAKYGGHSYNEVFIKELDQWIMIDVSYCLMFYYQEKYLSVIEFFQLSRKGCKISSRPLIKPQDAIEETVNRNFLNPHIVPFLITNYHNKIYDKFLKIFRPYLPVFLIHFIIYAMGRSYRYKFPIDDYRKIFS
ncbi:hypothetical protein MWU76_11540 [Gelidibacter sp. F2691]|nr:hypothetical protein [Gelidibacter sp. F2691]